MPPAPRKARAACTAAGVCLFALSSIVAAAPLDPCRPTVVCTVAVEQLPAVLLASGGYQLAVSNQPSVPLPSTGVVHVAIAEPVVVRLDGPAYYGSVSIAPQDCGDEDVHTITAAPKPAQLEFQAGALPLADLVVSCESGCPYGMRSADEFPELPFPRDATEMTVTLKFKALGYRSLTAEFRLTPGRNQIRVSLEKLDGG